MTKETKKQITSLSLTFLATFLATLSVGFESVNPETLELSVLGALIVTAVRAGLKSLLLKLVGNGS